MPQQNQKEVGKSLEKSLRNIVAQASREKLLPKIIWNADREFGSKKLINYQKSVRKQYEQDLKNPLKYDPQAAKSDRQKFREKVMKLMNHQLDVDYFDNIKLRDQYLVTYKGNQIQQCKIQTKKEFQMFKNFNEKRFKQTYSNIFQDKLQLGYQNLYQNRSNRRCQTLHILESKSQLPTSDLRTTNRTVKSKSRPVVTQISQISTTPRKKDNILIHSARKKAVIYFNEKKIVGSPFPHNEQDNVLQIMKQIGGYNPRFQFGNLNLTRQSINRWLKNLYEKSHRIIDFLQVKQVVNFQQFWDISKRLRVMPLDHILFMTFMYFDGNNDGYICDYDLERLSNLSLKRNVLTHDYQKIKHSNIKKILSKRQPYMDLYKLSEVTESKYFQWKKTNDSIDEGGIQLQMKNRLLSSKQKQIFIDYSSFCAIYKHQKPFLWYDLMYILSGLTYQGLKYS